MGIWIGISINQNSQNQANRTSNITVNVNASWNYGSWNHMNPPGYLIIDGARYDFRSSFNMGRTSNGSQTLFSKNVNVTHDGNGNKTVSCSAFFASDVSSGDVRASASRTLSQIAAITPPPPSKPPETKATITKFGLQSGTYNTVYATWTWSRGETEHYQVMWYYDTGDDIWFIGNDSTTKNTQSTYSAPSNAVKVKFKVKPVSKTRTVNNNQTSYWTAEWSTEKIYSFSENPPVKPNKTPTVTIENYVLTAELDNINPEDLNATHIQFQVVKDDSSIFSTGESKIEYSHAAYTCPVTVGSEYKVRCRSMDGTEYSEWTDYSNNVGTPPATPLKLKTCKATSSTSVYLEWDEIQNAKTYDIEYTTKLEYFDGSNETTIVTGIEFTKYEKTGLETGENYFFRVRAVNDLGESGWSSPSSISIGKKPAAPTTWSSTTTVITGEPLILYWVHNAEDGSNQKYAEVEITIDGVKQTYTVRTPESEEEEEENKTHSYEVSTSEYKEGTKILWRVRTSGVTLQYGDWSVQRTIDVYAPPTLSMEVNDQNGDPIDTLTIFPFYISALAGPKTQLPIGYHLTVTSNDTYQTIDEIGNAKLVNAGDQIFSRYFDINEELLVEMSAGNLDLENNMKYTVTCVVSMNSGLTAEASSSFTVSWTDDIYVPNAEIGMDTKTVSTFIKPYCNYYPTTFYKVSYDESSGVYTKTEESFSEDPYGTLVDNAKTTTGESVYHGRLVDGTETYYTYIVSSEPVLVEHVTLSVYRREFDGSFTEIIKNIPNSNNSYITDPHPSLDYARYRIVATSVTTGAVSYYDMPGYPIGEKSIVIQWAEDWSNFETNETDTLEQPIWSGSMLKLPYNIDVTESNKIDVALVEYAGRKHPVGYYGTQLGNNAVWNVAIEKSDKETIYALRRLAIWTGDAYVREPSGTGYWASISVSFSQKHRELTIPVTINITRVEGGV